MQESNRDYKKGNSLVIIMRFYNYKSKTLKSKPVELVFSVVIVRLVETAVVNKTYFICEIEPRL